MPGSATATRRCERHKIRGFADPTVLALFDQFERAIYAGAQRG
jgi:hypothetical protein